MPDITVPPPVFDFSMEEGASRTLQFAISSASDLTANGVSLAFTAVHEAGDVVPLIRKTYSKSSGGLVAANGISVSAGGVFTVQISPLDTLAAVARTTLLAYEAWYSDSSGNDQCVAKGTLKLRVRADTAVPPAV